jgi:hypothetical protein
MSKLWSPPKVSTRLREESAEREAAAMQGLDEARWKWVEDFNRDLENVWPGMRLLWCPDPAPVDAVAIGALPGRWGILMPSVHGSPQSVKPIVGPDGCFVDPSSNASAIFDGLRAGDWWNPEVRKDRERAQAEAERVKQKRLEQEREERDAWVMERYLSGNRASVSMSRDSAWAQNQSGRRAVKQKERT